MLRLRFVAVANTVVGVPAAAALEMTDDERAALERVARSSVLPHRKVVRAQALVWAGDGVANEEIARRVRVDADTVRRWRARFATSGVEGIGKIAKGRGRKPWLPTDIVQRVLTATREHTPPGEETHWTTRSMAAHVGVGKDTVARIWADHGLKPWKIDTFKVSTDPRFEEKTRRRGRVVSRPARAGCGVQLRREDLLPGAGSHPALAAAQAWPGSDDDA